MTSRAIKLDGSVFVIAGGAGVAGVAVASGLLQHGATVALTSRSEQRLERARGELESAQLHGFPGRNGRSC